MSYKQSIYNAFRRNGLTEAAALGFLGNWQCESENEPFRLQGDFSSYRTMSKAYVQGLTNGTISKQQFQNDQKGFGLAQWTYWSRKADLYDFWKASGKAIDDASLQVDFAMKELRESYGALLTFLKSTNDVFTACSRICREYERPAVNNIDARFQAANKIKYEIDLNAWEDGDDPQPEPEPEPKHELVLRVIDCNCSGFYEIYLLQSLLLCRNYQIPVDGVWIKGDTTDLAVEAFQKANGLEPDKCVGNKTWNKLMER